MVKIKIGFSGPPCSGKTTTVHEVVVELRKRGIKVDVLSGIERIPLYDINRMYDITEHNISLMNHVLQESLYTKRPDIDVLLVDRTPLDILIDMEISAVVEGCEKCEHIKTAMTDYTVEWMNTYDIVFILPPLKFKKDGLRLENEPWRINIIKLYKDLLIVKGDKQKITLSKINIKVICDEIIDRLKLKGVK
jgi:DNA polymerase III delta prime subunit